MRVAELQPERNLASVRKNDAAKRWAAQTRLNCAGWLRPHVIWFGEPLPRAELKTAMKASHDCEVFISIGISGVVQPAATLAYAVHNRGAIVVEINAEATPLTQKTDFFFQGKSGEILPELVKAVWNP